MSVLMASTGSRELEPHSPHVAQAIRSAVDRIAGNPLFAGSERLSRFLRYVVEETLAGRSEAIKEYSIGVEVYGRSADYDPKIDATVRVEAGRLRSKLSKYYAGEGAAGTVRIELPRGTYVPVFSTGDIRATSPDRNTISAPATRPPKKIGTPVGAAALAVAGLAALGTVVWLGYGILHRPTVLSLAVLPLVNAGGEVGARFSLGLADQMTGELAEGDAFPVASRTETDRFRNSTLPLVEIAKRLQVNSVIEGTVQSEEGRLRVTLQLVMPRNGHHVWSQTYESLPGRLDEFQGKVSYLVARTLRARFAGVPEKLIAGGQSQNGEAVALYQRGNEAWLTQRRQGLEESLVYYARAIEKDAGFAKAYEGIAASELFLASLDYNHAGTHVIQAKTAAEKAIAIDSRLADPHARLGNMFLRREWDFVRAEEELHRSVMLEPGSSPITRWYAEAARLREKYADARSELEYGLMANATSEVMETELGLLDYQLDRLSDAEAHLRRTLAMQPGYRLAHFLAGLLHERAGRFPEAEKELRVWSNLTEFGQQCLAALGHVLGVQGKAQEASQIAAQLENVPRRSMSLVAVVYLGMGDRDRMFDALEKAYQERDPFLPLIKNDTRFHPAMSDARFCRFLERLGLPTIVQ